METIIAALRNNDTFMMEQMFLFKKFIERNEGEELLLATTVTFNFVFNDKHFRVEEFFEEWLPRYLDYDFYSLYRIKRETFAIFLAAINCEEKIYLGGSYHPVPIEKQLLMTLWWLGKGEVLLSVADRFNVALSTVYNCTEYILEKILDLKDRLIVWPDNGEIIQIEDTFRDRSGFPGVIGAIDGTCIKFKPPKDQQNSYIDKELNHSIKLQGIVTANKIFTNICVGFPGSAHDSRVFLNSSLYVDIEENGNLDNYFYGKDYHLIGDKAYPLRKWIMTPYKDNNNLNNIRRRYNHYHSITRVVVEHTFGILKKRWAILSYINVNKVEKAVKIIAACCILHNFCYINYDFWEYYEANAIEDNDVINDYYVDASHKRNQIAEAL